jgi:hypothetical protein
VPCSGTTTTSAAPRGRATARRPWRTPTAPGVWASANAHWNGASSKHYSGTPPVGSFVYWNISAYGHVGIADGSGGIYATSIGGKIGHASSVNYFNNYRGWTNTAVPSR